MKVYYNKRQFPNVEKECHSQIYWGTAHDEKVLEREIEYIWTYQDFNIVVLEDDIDEEDWDMVRENFADFMDYITDVLIQIRYKDLGIPEYEREWRDIELFEQEFKVVRGKLASWLAENDINPKEVSDLIGEIKTGYKDLENFKKKPEDYVLEEIEFLKDDMGDMESQLEEYEYKFKEENPGSDWEKESAYLIEQYKCSWEKE